MCDPENEPLPQDSLAFQATLVSHALGSVDMFANNPLNTEAQKILREKLPIYAPENGHFLVRPVMNCIQLLVSVSMAGGETQKQLLDATDKKILDVEGLAPETIYRDEENFPVFLGDRLEQDIEKEDRFVVVSVSGYIRAHCNPYLNTTRLVF